MPLGDSARVVACLHAGSIGLLPAAASPLFGVAAAWLAHPYPSAQLMLAVEAPILLPNLA
jgi:hypothetical protein